eukprot:EG_transcript_32650
MQSGFCLEAPHREGSFHPHKNQHLTAGLVSKLLAASYGCCWSLFFSSLGSDQAPHAHRKNLLELTTIQKHGNQAGLRLKTQPGVNVLGICPGRKSTKRKPGVWVGSSGLALSGSQPADQPRAWPRLWQQDSKRCE